MENNEKAKQILATIKDGNKEMAKSKIEEFLFSASASAIEMQKKEMAKTLFNQKK